MKLIYEKSIFAQGYGLIGSIDEAGRGPLAGPVIAACVIVPCGYKIKNKKLYEVKDSKKLSLSKRKDLEKLIKDEFIYSTGMADHEEIDRLNILNATFSAMKSAVDDLIKKPDYVMVDGSMFIPGLDIKQQKIIKGDSKVFSIAAASIIAKTARDKIMEEYDKIFPGYGFSGHKGYGTKEHMEKLKKLGPCAIHRRSFNPVRSLVE